MSPLRSIDDLLYRQYTRHWPPAKVESYVRKVASDGDKAALPDAVHRAFGEIDTKAASLLTHVSMMVAALGITATLIANSPLEQGFMVTQIMLYLLVAIACLRCSALFRAVTEDEMSEEKLRKELVLRRETFNVCNVASIYLTILVFVSLPILAYL